MNIFQHDTKNCNKLKDSVIMLIGLPLRFFLGLFSCISNASFHCVVSHWWILQGLQVHTSQKLAIKLAVT
jgi:hypothetical protein